MYEKGWSVRAIAKHFGYSKTKVRNHLLAEGVALRTFSKSQQRAAEKANGMYSGATPYGYAFLEGQLVKDPNEYKIVLEIYQLWLAGKSLRAIAKDLDVRNIPTRHGKSWKHEVVKKIIERFDLLHGKDR